MTYFNAMKALLLVILSIQIVTAQEAVHNYGSMQIHANVSVGFHMDVINDGAFNKNLGLVGFYSDNNNISISGSSNPIFYDAEIAVTNYLYIDNTVGILNNLSFISGDVVTSRVTSEVNINFLEDSFYVGDGQETKVDGYSAIIDKKQFVFPVGEGKRVRPLSILSPSNNDYAKCAYFFENPNTPSIFGKGYKTERKDSEFLSISEKEFWHLEGDLPSNITLSWDEYSEIATIVNYISDLKVVGWHRAQKQWVNLGNIDVQGEMMVGTVTSDLFIPNEYEIITLGGNDDALEEFTTIELDNYFITPNNDGKNDFLVLEGIEQSSNNLLQIFNRYGVLIYSKNNYQNEFNGISNRSSVINKDSGLASGIYFYIITMNDLRLKHQGYLYLSTGIQN